MWFLFCGIFLYQLRLSHSQKGYPKRSYKFLTPKRVIQNDLVINKQDLVKDKLFRLNEPFQLINSRDKI